MLRLRRELTVELELERIRRKRLRSIWRDLDHHRDQIETAMLEAWAQINRVLRRDQRIGLAQLFAADPPAPRITQGSGAVLPAAFDARLGAELDLH